MRSVARGVRGEGFSTTALPARIAGIRCQTAIITGKFQGVIEPTTPIGLRWSSTLPSLVSCRTWGGRARPAVWFAQAAAPPSSQREPRPFRGLPCSRVRSWASSSAWATRTCATARQAAARASSGRAAQGPWAARAAATARSRSAAVAFGAVPTTAPVAGLRTSKRSEVATLSPPIVMSSMGVPPGRVRGPRTTRVLCGSSLCYLSDIQKTFRRSQPRLRNPFAPREGEGRALRWRPGRGGRRRSPVRSPPGRRCG